MFASVRGLQSPDVPDLRKFSPAQEHNFGFLLDVIAGPRGGDSGEQFSLLVCTPEWLREKVASEGPRFGHGLLIVPTYDYSVLERMIKRMFETLEGENWTDLAHKLSRYADWEFDNYRESKQR